MPWTLCLWGKVELVDSDNQPVALPTRKHLLILAVLGRSGGCLSRDGLAAAVWPNAGTRGRASLRGALPAIRQALPGVLRVSDDAICLDGAGLQITGDATQPFMPGFDEDWVIDHRLADREEAVGQNLQRATARLEAGDLKEAEQAARAAVELDPYSAAASRMLSDVLLRAGEVAGSRMHQDRFGARLVRDLGIAPAVIEDPPPATPPVVAAVEWLIERDTEEAAALLAATQAQWLIMPLDQALSVHDRVLAQLRPDSRWAPSLTAVKTYQEMMAGRWLGKSLEPICAQLDQALRQKLWSVAMQLKNLLAYATLSRGEFRAALAYAHGHLRLAQEHGSDRERCEAILHLAVFQEHCGLMLASHRTIRVARQAIDATDSVLLRAMVTIMEADMALREGRLDAAHDSLVLGRRLYSTLGLGRMEVWVSLAEARLAVALGSTTEALRGIDRIKQVGVESGGHSVVALTEELEASIFCGLGEFDLAADALVRAQAFRRKLGSVPSRAEARAVAAAKRLVRQKVSQADLRRAVRRVAESR